MKMMSQRSDLAVGCGSRIKLTEIGNLLEYFYSNLDGPKGQKEVGTERMCQGRINRIRCLIRYSRKIRKN